MARSTQPIPPGFHAITPHLTVDGAAKYLEFLQKAFGATDVEQAPGPGGKLMHAQAKIGDSMLMFADHFPEFGTPPIAQGHWPLVLNYYCADADAAFDRAVKAGCSVIMPLADQFWGDRYGQVRDPFGFMWAISTHVEDVSPQEMEKRMSKMFGSGGAA